ncbi:hypothetical protein FB451DRAFT_1175347 [Mycena latifolia]|nr:hypothetical protein FB451DRAFT_1175347 [Mycena latifolia]
MFNFNTVLAAMACSLLGRRRSRASGMQRVRFRRRLLRHAQHGAQGTQVGVSFFGLTAGQSFTLAVIDLVTCKPFTGFAVSTLSANVVDTSFDIYNPGSTQLSNMVSTTDVSSNKLTTVASVPNGATDLNLNVVVTFVDATTTELISVMDKVGVLLA